MRNVFSNTNIKTSTVVDNLARSGSGSVGLLGAAARPTVATKVSSYFTPEKTRSVDEHGKESVAKVSRKDLNISSGEDSDDEDRPPQKKSKLSKEDALASRRANKKTEKKAAKDSPAGIYIHKYVG